MELRNLKDLAENLRNSFASSFDPSDRKLPQSFKDRVTRINSFNLTYNDYSVVFGGSTGSLDSYIPNQLFYIAAHYNEYTQQLFYYKSEIMKVINASGFSGDLTKFFTTEREIKNREDSQFYALLKDLDIKEEDKELLYKFVTDYGWWHGAKTIDRQDFFNSPILNVMGMTASSNSTLAMICGFFANKPDVADLLNTENKSAKTLISDKVLTSFILKCVKELSNIDNLNSLIPYISSPIIEGKPIKIASDEDGFSLTGMFLETNEEDRVARNETIPRWFPDIFTLDGHQVYLSTQWNGKGDYQLTKADFVKMLEVCYPNRFSCIVDEVPHTLRLYSEPLQTIYYGSPGTGKSHIVEHKVLDGVPEHFQFRTTFHPDTDYASFVGCYKPVCKDVEDNCQIVYEFVPQVFTDAYVAAWQNPNQQVYLMIEEINRGNCAQIFGDLFQLLDRKNGVSQYKVKAEKDLANYLMEMLAGDAEGGILDGKLSLPANLNIVATMNTSDQSLFPMDSAFKRRWDWKYIPTTPPTDKNKVIEIGDRKYDWKAFLNAINERIQEATRSEDKKLGFWFVKTQEGKDIISDNTFASKVIFYLWNDVFKDLGDKGNPFVCEVGGKTALTSFNSFFMMNSDGDVVVNVDAIHKFMANLGLNPIE